MYVLVQPNRLILLQGDHMGRSVILFLSLIVFMLQYFLHVQKLHISKNTRDLMYVIQHILKFYRQHSRKHRKDFTEGNAIGQSTKAQNKEKNILKKILSSADVTNKLLQLIFKSRKLEMLMTSWQLTATGYLPICSWLLKRTRKLYKVEIIEEEKRKLQAAGSGQLHMLKLFGSN